MFFSDYSLFLFSFFLLITTFITNSDSTLHLLLTAELLWITLFSLVVIIGLVYNNLNILTLTFFFLVFSAIEFAIGLVLMLLQNTLLRTIYLTDSTYNTSKFLNRFYSSLYLNKIKWKF